MNCAETKKHIEALADGELTGKAKATVENHLQICSACRTAKEDLILLSGFLEQSEIAPPSAALEKHLLNSFRQYQKPKNSRTRRHIFFGALLIPKPIFAAFLLLTATTVWAAFQIGKINSSVVSMTAPPIAATENQIRTPAETETRIVHVEVPVVKEKIVTRTVYVREPAQNIQRAKAKTPDSPKSGILPSYNSVAENGYFTDVNLRGFEPTAEMNAKIIKEVKENEK